MLFAFCSCCCCVFLVVVMVHFIYTHTHTHIYIYIWTIQITTTRKSQKRKRKKEREKREAFTSIFFSLLFTNNENKNSKYIQAQKFNKHSCTKDSPEHDFICQSGSYAGQPWSLAQTCTFSFSEEESSRERNRDRDTKTKRLPSLHIVRKLQVKPKYKLKNI